MSPTFDAFLRSWPSDPWLIAALALLALTYLRGWRRLRRRDPRHWSSGKPTAFLGGLSALFLALASPIEPFASLLLQVHMVQHLLLMMVAPPLLWLGAPLLPLIRGMPATIRVYWVAPLLRSRSLRGLFARLTHPAPALLLFVASTWLWHVPLVYGTALRVGGVHYLQHLCFLGSALVFWYPVVRPFPSRPRWSPWLLVPYLILADLQNTVLAALLTFSDRVIYPRYSEVPRLMGLSALDDQAAAGVIMWVPGSVVFLLPLFGIGLRLLAGEPRQRETRRTVGPATGRPGSRSGVPGVTWPELTVLAVAPAGVAASPSPRPRAGLDVLRLPWLGGFLRWRHSRFAMQLPLLVLAIALIVDGFRGPRVGAMNLAGVLPWIHWRGLAVLGLLAAGNLSCMACPFMLPRTLARRWLPARRRWPRALRNKWPAVALLILFLWSYEAFSLWDRPPWTASIAVAYFAAAFVIDGLFQGASFCKSLCPIGQFNFVQSQVSPLEIQVRDPCLCATCRTKDCIRGRGDLPGCELGLFLPRKVGNLDCTFCLDCVHACPHGNVGIVAGLPGRDLAIDPYRSGIGRLGRRPDLAALVLVLVFGGFANAAGMVGPVVEWQDRLRKTPGSWSPLGSPAAFSFLALLVLPLLLHGSAAALGRRWGRLVTSWREVAMRHAYALVPLGFAMWLSHLGFHLLTSYGTVLPTAHRFAADLGWAALGAPDWGRACCLPTPGWLLRIEIVFLDLGMLLSLSTAYRIAIEMSPRPSRALKAFAPWAILIVLMFAAGIWIVLQPMQMRGTLPVAG